MKRIEDIKEFKDIDTYYEISKIVDEIFQDRVEVYKHLVIANEEIEKLNKRIDKAIEYIKSFGSDSDRKNYSLYYNDIFNKVLNILKGSDKE